MPKSKILFIAANPETLPPIDAVRELNTIRDASQKGDFRDHVNLDAALEVKVGDLADILTKGKPQLLHVCAHGDEAGALQLRDSNVGTPAAVPLAELARMLRNAAPNAECVVLSACYSEQQAKDMLHEGVRFVVGASQAVSGEEATTFARVFYTALVNGLTLQAAFELARDTLKLELLRKDALSLLSAEGSRPDQWKLIDPATLGSLRTQSVTHPTLPTVPAATGSAALPQGLRDQLLLSSQLFAGSLTQMELVRQYKQVHDDLQELEAALRMSLEKLEAAFDDNDETVAPLFPMIRPNLRDASVKMESLIRLMGIELLQEKYEDARSTLQMALDRVKEALQTKSTTPLTADVNDNLKTMLALELPKANDRLVAGVEQLQPDMLAQALQKVRAAAASLSPMPPSLATLLSQAEAFAGRAEDLKRLNKEHTAWQTIDNKLRSLASQRGNFRKFLKQAWPLYSVKVLSMMQSSAGGWVDELKDQHGALNSELDKTDDNMLRAEFDEYYRLITQRFSATDKALLEISGRINDSGREIYGQLRAMVQ